MTQTQREAIFDFLLLAMYADGNLKLSEDSRIYELVSTLGTWESYQDAREYSDTAISRVRAAIETEGALDPYLAAVSARLSDDETRNLALILFARLMEVDEAVAGSEYELYSRAKAVFGI